MGVDRLHQGGCACGAVRFEARGEPSRVGLCHCMTCRTVHGAPFNAFAVFPEERVTLSGEVGTFHSSQRGHRHFCAACGSRVHSQYDGEGEIELPLGNFDAPSRFAPTYELWIKRREAWLPEIPGILRRYDENRTGTQPSEP